MKADTLLSVENISLSYRTRKALFRHEHFIALNGVSFNIKKGETLGIIGNNGCGKSTLLKVLAGIYQPDEGKVKKNCDTVTLLSLGLGFNNELSGVDNAILSAVLLGKTKQEAKESLEEIIAFSELGDFAYQPVKTYSSGMRARLGFSVAITLNSDLLLIDEALSVGDATFRDKAEKVMLNKINSSQTVVFVSHSESQIKKLCDRCVWLDSGRVRLVGETNEVFQNYKKAGV